MKLGARSHLANRILIMVAAIIIALTAIFTIFYALHMHNVLDARQKEEGVTISESIAGGSELGILTGDKRFLSPIFQGLMDHEGAIFIVAYNENGSIVHQASQREIDLSLSPESAAELMKLDHAALKDTIRLHDIEINDFYAPVFSSEDADDWSESLLGEDVSEDARSAGKVIGLVRLGLSRENIDLVKRQSLTFSLSAAFAIMAIGIFVASVVSRRITNPISQLEKVTRRISEGDLDVDLEVESNDEVGSLASAFNSMATALRQTTVSKDYVDSIVSSMNDSLFVFSADKTISGINSAASALLGYEPSEIEGRPAEELFKDKTIIDTARWNAIGAGASVANADVDFLRKDGSQVRASLSVAAMFDGQGRFRGAVGVARDVTEVQRLLIELQRRSEDLEHHRVVLTSMLEDNERARQEAEAEKQKTSAAVESMAEGLIMFNLTGEILLINPSARIMLRLADEERADSKRLSTELGFDLAPFLSAEEDSPGAHLLHDSTTGEIVKRTLRIEGIPVGVPGKRIGSMLVIRDVTRERQLDEAKHELLTNVSHELRTPLAAISNIISNTLVGVTGAISDKLRDHLEIARINTKRLSNIIDNLLDIASLDAGNVVIRREPCNLSALVDDVVKSLDPEMAQKEIRLDMQMPAEPIELYCDGSAMNQVLRNLISNAIRFTPHGGLVGLTIEHIENDIGVTVIDSGAGIPPEDQQSIFERFHQVGRTYGPGEKGLGLGLPISRHLVEMHGGSIGVTSSPGRGSRFYFRIPLLSGMALAQAYLEDRLQEMTRGGAVPRLWLFSPRITEAHTNTAESDLMAIAVERLESVVREVLIDAKSITTHLEETGEVAAIVMELRDDETGRTAEKMERSLRQFSFTHSDRRIVCGVSMSNVACLDAQSGLEHYLKGARKSLK